MLNLCDNNGAPEFDVEVNGDLFHWPWFSKIYEYYHLMGKVMVLLMKTNFI